MFLIIQPPKITDIFELNFIAWILILKIVHEVILILYYYLIVCIIKNISDEIDFFFTSKVFEIIIQLFKKVKQIFEHQTFIILFKHKII